MKPFPVKIDLSDFFDDKQKMVMLLVDPDWDGVETLQQRVKTLFNIVSLEFKSDDGFYIPPQEPIKLIKHVQLLKAFIPKKTKSVAAQQLPREVVEPLIQKRKFYSLGIDMATDDALPKQKKRKSKRSCAVANESDELQINGQKSASATGDLSEMCTATNELSAYLDDLVDQQKSVISPPMQILQNRMRHRKKKNRQDVSNETAAKESLLTSPPNDSTCASASQPGSEESATNTHTFFDETGQKTNDESVQPPEVVPAAKVIFRCDLRKIDSIQPRVFIISKKPQKEDNGISKAFAVKSPKIYEKHGINLTQDVNRNIEALEAQEHQRFENSTQTDITANTKEPVETDQNANVSMAKGAESAGKTVPVENIDAASNNDKTTDNGKEASMETSMMSEIIELNESDTADFTNDIPTVEKMLALSTELIGMPNIGNTVLFKVTSSEKPDIVSKYIAGKLDHFNKRTKTLKFFIIDGHEELCNFSTKFACDLNNTTNTQIFYIKRSELIEPKVLLGSN